MASDNKHPRNTDGLRAYAAGKSEATHKRIDEAIRALSMQNSAINFNSVATLSKVSKTTLYNDPVYRERIEKLRCSAPAKSMQKKDALTDKSKDNLLVAKNRRIAELELEVSRLSEILKRCYAKEYEKY